MLDFMKRQINIDKLFKVFSIKHNSRQNYSQAVTGFVVNESYVENMPTENEDDKPINVISEFFDWLEMAITAIISVVIIFTLIFRIATIEGPSMRPTLWNNDKVIITNFAYTPKFGDIVVISRNIDNTIDEVGTGAVPIIKRVIAVAGQTVDIDFEKGVVFVDGVQLKEDYVNTPTNLKYDVNFPVYVPDGCIFVLGDNRNDSLDSRDSRIGNNGLIDARYVLGHAVFRVFPFNRIGRLY